MAPVSVPELSIPKVGRNFHLRFYPGPIPSCTATTECIQPAGLMPIVQGPIAKTSHAEELSLQTGGAVEHPGSFCRRPNIPTARRAARSRNMILALSINFFRKAFGAVRNRICGSGNLFRLRDRIPFWVRGGNPRKEMLPWLFFMHADLKFFFPFQHQYSTLR